MKINKIYLSTISLLVLLVVFAVLMLFKIKYYTEDLDKILSQITVEIEKKHESINVLQAELSYLTTPKRIEKLVKKHLTMLPISSKQVKRHKHYTVMARKN